MAATQHLYVHVPFCRHRCGYCDFVTVTGRESERGTYVDAVLAEARAGVATGTVAAEPETVYLGGGTPSRLGPQLLDRLLGDLPHATGELTVECNPEDVDDDLAAVLAGHGARVSLGAQTFRPDLLAVLERQARPDDVRAAVARLRAAGVVTLSLDLIYGIPGQDPGGLAEDLVELVELGPDHVSAYELEAKPGTRFTYRHGSALAAQAEQLEALCEQVVAALEGAGYDWYETASFARDGRRAVHNSAYWRGCDYVGVGVGAVSTVASERRTNGPRLGPYIAALADGAPAPHRVEVLDEPTRALERLMLGLRLAEGVELAAVADVVDAGALARLEAHGLVETVAGTLRLARSGRLLLHGIVTELVRDDRWPTD